MQSLDTRKVDERLPQLPLPYKYEGLKVLAASPTRLTPVSIGNASELWDEVVKPLSLVKRLIEPKTATVMVGLGLRQEGRTVRGHVRRQIIIAEQGRQVANFLKTLSTPKLAPRSEGISTSLKLEFKNVEVEMPELEVEL